MAATTTTVTRAQAERVLEAVREAFAGYAFEWDDDGERGAPRADGPTLYEPGFHDRGWTVAWEGGPFEWTVLFPHGGVDEEMTELVAQAAAEFGFEPRESRVPDVSDRLPAGVGVEPLNHWAVAIFTD